MNSFDPAIYNEKYENGIVDNNNFVPFIIKDIINEKQKKEIYEQVEKIKEDYILQKFAGHCAWNFENKDLEEHLNSVLSNYLGEEVVLIEYSFARYSKSFGYKPKLFPHFDTHEVDGQRITVDIQLNSSLLWGVVVEGEKYYFDNLDALVFSGTQQIHWRENKTLGNNDVVDMVFAHFAYKKNKPWSLDQREILEYKSHRLREYTGITNIPEPNGV